MNISTSSGHQAVKLKDGIAGHIENAAAELLKLNEQTTENTEDTSCKDAQDLAQGNNDNQLTAQQDSDSKHNNTAPQNQDNGSSEQVGGSAAMLSSTSSRATTRDTPGSDASKALDENSNSLKQTSDSTITQSTALTARDSAVPSPTKDYKVLADWEESELVYFVREALKDLGDLDEHANSQSLNILKAVGDAYFKYAPCRQKVAEVMIEEDYPDLVVSMLKEFNAYGIFKNDDVWFPAYYTLNSTWNYTDASRKLAKCCVDAGIVKLMVANLIHQPYLDNLQSKNVAYIVKSSLSICQNISKVPESKPVFRDNNAIEALKPFSKSDNDFYKATSMMTMTAIMDDDENAALEDSGAIPYMVECISKAIDNKKRRHRGFTPTELTEGLARMAVNDSNKITIVEAGALPLFVKMLKHDDTEEQVASGQALWTLAFDKSARELIKDEPECIETLEKLKQDSESKDVQRCTAGALWVVLEKTATASEENSKDQGNHVFISYNHGDQQMCIAIKDRLKSDGYRVWMDVDFMGGSTLEAMATAVEQAEVVLICACERYKLSPNCRTEAEYVHTLNKTVVPLMMQRHYKADGWLGMLMGAKFYVNFDGKYEFDKAYELLLRELGERGKGEIVNAPITAAVAPTMSAAPPPAPAASSVIVTWSTDDVADWLDENKLSRLSGVFADYDGKMLSSLRQIKREAPEFFYRNLETKLELNFRDILLLVDAIGNLPG